jgi:serine-type D-Ala-D-Ala carboxypeptidase/endopeptidase (penicillin-binding protein 4)
MAYKHKVLFIGCCIMGLFTTVNAQNNVKAKLEQALKEFERDPQMKGASYSLYIKMANADSALCKKNEETGLVTASCLKVLTSCTALDIFGDKHSFLTVISANKNTLKIEGSGDPTFGSWRYPETKPDIIYQKIVSRLNIDVKRPVKVFINDKLLGSDRISGGSIWEDIGNYFGSQTSGFNWHENQTDAIFKTGNTGQKISFVKTDPVYKDLQFDIEATTGLNGTGDNALVYFTPGSGTKRLVKGTLEGEKNMMEVSVAVPNAAIFFKDGLQKYCKEVSLLENDPFITNIKTDTVKKLMHRSPTLDKIVYEFNRKSINHYGDALMRLLGIKLSNEGSFNKAAEAINKYWVNKDIGIEPHEIKIYDGSGLSPQTRVTTKALVNIMQYAYDSPWYKSFYESLPTYNNMKLKSGTINDVKGFTGIHTSKDGTVYLMSFLVNNYNGESNSIVSKMFNILDELK